jgi:two-component system phosphate regulon sensor histidine kinase PhoR
MVFERYWRPDRVRASRVEGSGLGLAIVREVADAHGGRVGVSSRPDEGTTFWITLPALGAAAAPGV